MGISRIYYSVQSKAHIGWSFFCFSQITPWGQLLKTAYISWWFCFGPRRRERRPFGILPFNFFNGILIGGIFTLAFSRYFSFSRFLFAILTDPIYLLVAGGETSPWAKPSCDISPRGDIPKNRCPRWDSNPEPCAIKHRAGQDGTTKPSLPTIWRDPTYADPAHLTTHRGIYYLHVEQFLVDVMFIATISYD
jgi:hypothetical protein